jgi:hypothetical protein
MAKVKNVFFIMGGIKVESFGEKSKGNQLDSWTVGSWTKSSGESTIRRSCDFKFEIPINIEYRLIVLSTDQTGHLTSATVPFYSHLSPSGTGTTALTSPSQLFPGSREHHPLKKQSCKHTLLPDSRDRSFSRPILELYHLIEKSLRPSG